MELPEATKVRLKTQHLVIQDLIKALSKEQFDQEIFTDKWSVRQQLAHLVRYQEVFFERVQIIMNNFNAVFSPYVADDDEGFLKAAQMPAPQLVGNLNELRKTITDFYFCLDSGELSRKGRHTQLGNFSIALWAEFFLLHEAHHIFQIYRMNNRLTNNNDT